MSANLAAIRGIRAGAASRGRVSWNEISRHSNYGDSRSSPEFRAHRWARSVFPSRMSRVRIPSPAPPPHFVLTATPCLVARAGIRPPALRAQRSTRPRRPLRHTERPRQVGTGPRAQHLEHDPDRPAAAICPRLPASSRQWLVRRVKLSSLRKCAGRYLRAIRARFPWTRKLCRANLWWCIATV